MDRSRVRGVLAALVVGAVLVGCQPAPLPQKAPIGASPLTFGANQRRLVDNVIIVTDASGTMYANQTFPEAKALTQSFVAAMPEASAPSRSGRGYDAGLIGFGGNARSGVALTAFNRAALARAAGNLAIMGDIDERGGTTPYRNVFKEIQNSLAGASGLSAVVLFSDGMPDLIARAEAAAKALSKSKMGEVCFHAVHTGTDPVGRAQLTDIASQFSCGTVRSSSKLRSASDLRAFAYDVFGETTPAPTVTPDPCQRVVRLRGIGFAFDKANITPDSAVVLDVAVDQLNKCPAIAVRIDGYTDSIGTEAYNLQLSKRRADAVRTYFVDHGVAARRLTTKGFGESNPIDTNETEDGRARNRRVELLPQK